MADSQATIGASCGSCDWSLTVGNAVERLEAEPFDRPTPGRIHSKLGSLSEGHAYFNRGHTVSLHLSEDEIERCLDAERDRS